MPPFQKKEIAPKHVMERSRPAIVEHEGFARDAAISHAKRLFDGALVAAIGDEEAVTLAISAQGRRREVTARNWTEMIDRLIEAKRRLW